MGAIDTKEMAALAKEVAEWAAEAGEAVPWGGRAQKLVEDLASPQVSVRRAAKGRLESELGAFCAWHDKAIGPGVIDPIRAKGWSVSGTPESGWTPRAMPKAPPEDEAIRGPHATPLEAWKAACRAEGEPPPATWSEKTKEVLERARSAANERSLGAAR